MNARIKEIYDRSEGRYFDPGEVSELVGYGESLLSRLDTMQAVERAEKAILDSVVHDVMERHPEMAGEYGKLAIPFVRRDQLLVLRYAAFAALLHDQAFMYDKLAVWLRTILLALCKPEQVVYGFKQLAVACRSHLTPADADAIVPFVEVVIREFESNGGKAS
jgi:hypothetical protein